jgi:hypothetical protein
MTTIYNNKYDIDGEAANDQSGHSVSMNSAGDIVAIGAISAVTNSNSKTGHVRVYQRIDGKWEQLGIDIDGEAVDDKSGISVSMNSAGDIVAIGAVSNDGNGNNSGHVRVYQYIDTPDGPKPKAWSKLGIDIDGEAAGDQSGHSVSMNSTGDIVAISSIFNDDDGHVRIWKYINDINIPGTKIWSMLGQDIDAEAEHDQSGHSVSMNSTGDIVAISSTRNAGDNKGRFTGHVRVWKYTDATWQRLGLDIDGDVVGTLSGYSVSMNSAGDIVAIGALRSGGLGGPGRVRVYQFINDTDNPSTKPWSQLGNYIDGEDGNDQSATVSMNSAGDIVAIGAALNDGNSAGINYGHVRVWKYDGFSWSQLGDDIDGEVAGDQSGAAVSMNSSGDIVAIGAINATGNDDGDPKSGHTRVFYYRNGEWNQAPPGFFKVSDTGVFTISGTGLFTVQ